MLFTFLVVVDAIVAAALIGVILMQKSEGGGLGVGGSPAGLLSARGAADFLTRATAVLATAFVLLSITLAVLASMNGRARQVDTSAAAKLAPVQSTVPEAPTAPLATGGPAITPNAGAGASAADPLAGAANAATGAAAPASAPVEKGVPLQQ